MKGIGSNSVSRIVISFPEVLVVWKKLPSGFISFQMNTFLFSSLRCRNIRLLTPPIRTFKESVCVLPSLFDILIVIFLEQFSAWSRISSDSLYNCAGCTTLASISWMKIKKFPSPLPVKISWFPIEMIYVARELLLIDNLIGLPVNAIFAGDMFAVRLILLDN